MKLEVPKEVREVAAKLVQTGHEAYLVGGCVRDLLLGRPPKDWDIATGARPEEIQKDLVTIRLDKRNGKSMDPLIRAGSMMAIDRDDRESYPIQLLNLE